MKDKDIRVHLRPWLQQRHAHRDALTIEEWGQLWSTRPDLAIFEPHEFHAYEIKSDHDSLTRLSKQLTGYAAFFHKITVVTGNWFAQDVRNAVPNWVGLVVVAPDGRGGAKVTLEREAHLSPVERHVEIALWRNDQQKLLKQHGLTGTSRMSSTTCYAHLQRLRLPDAEMLPFIIASLRARYGSRARSNS